ncbi:hypothetical protein NYF95_002426 [Salmonella enterica]|nr:hypothetical protein [Salmonella enterica]EJQ9383913.1 hypothetical protein [Salmonella enterica]
MNKYIFIIISLVSFIFMTGCKDKGQDFIGSWKQLTDDKYPSHILIKYDEGIYHVDVNSLNSELVRKKEKEAYMNYMWGKTKDRPSDNMDLSDCYKIKKMEAKAINDNTLQGNGFSMRLENGKVKYNGNEFVKE